MKNLLLYLCVITFVFSCSNDDSNQSENPELESNFYALTVGNSWVYKNYKYDVDMETYEDSGVIDSVSIIGTELISGNTYYKFRTKTTGNDNSPSIFNMNGETFELLRDSIGYLIDDSGTIKFMNNDFSERLASVETWGTIYEQLNTNSVVKEVEAGSFECSEMELWAILNNGIIPPGRQQRLYSDEIGLILYTISFLSSPFPVAEIRLDSYEVQ